MPTISGIAKLSDGSPASEVIAVSRSTNVVSRATPDLAGSYTIALSNGEWVVTGLGPVGYRPQSHLVQVSGLSFEDQILQDNPWAWWKLDDAEGATFTSDSSGSGRHLTGTLNPLVKRKKPPLVPDGGYSQTFDGTSGCMNSGSLEAFAGHVPLSLFCVIKPNSFSASAHLIHNGNTGVSGGQGQLLMLETNGALKFYCNSSGGWQDLRSDAGALTLGETAIVGWVHDPVADTLKFYKNGVVIKSYTYASGLGGGGSNMWSLGGLNGNAPAAYCDMDHALVFNKALSEERIFEHAVAAGLA